MRRPILSFLSISLAGALCAGVLGLSALGAAPSASQALAPRASVKFAKGFSIAYKQGYKLVDVGSPWPGASAGYRYVLYRRGSPKPAGLVADRFVEIPIRSAITFSTSYLPQIAAIGEADSVVGVDAAAFVSTPEILARIKAGKVAETTSNWAPNIELMISLAPEAVFTYGMGNEWDSYPKLLEAGLPVIIDGEWNEQDPLGRAEWIKFIAAFYDKEEQASAYFDRVAAEYERVKALAAGAKERPSILVNGPFQGTWYVSGGDSFMARFLADAGGAYLWADAPGTGGLSLSVEAAYERGRRASIWLNPGAGIARLSDLVALDSRFASLPVLSAGEVWNNDLRVNGAGGNDYFESAVLRPDRVLADLVKIIHPGLMAETPFTYYRKLAK